MIAENFANQNSQQSTFDIYIQNPREKQTVFPFVRMHLAKLRTCASSTSYLYCARLISDLDDFAA